jgi:hypothetical protein
MGVTSGGQGSLFFFPFQSQHSFAALSQKGDLMSATMVAGVGMCIYA